MFENFSPILKLLRISFFYQNKKGSAQPNSLFDK